MNTMIISTLAIFTLASVFCQIKSIKNLVAKFDKFQFLPNYTFFAPIPISHDYRIVYQIQDCNEWKEVNVYNRFYLLRCVWNPAKYYQKGIIDSCQFLQQEYVNLNDKKIIKISLHYLNICTLISKTISQVNKNTSIRFSIVISKGVEDIRIKKVLFTSSNQII